MIVASYGEDNPHAVQVVRCGFCPVRDGKLKVQQQQGHIKYPAALRCACQAVTFAIINAAEVSFAQIYIFLLLLLYGHYFRGRIGLRCQNKPLQKWVLCPRLIWKNSSWVFIFTALYFQFLLKYILKFFSKAYRLKDKYTEMCYNDISRWQFPTISWLRCVMSRIIC